LVVGHDDPVRNELDVLFDLFAAKRRFRLWPQGSLLDDEIFAARQSRIELPGICAYDQRNWRIIGG
jgi:hypothetical protein